MLSACLLSQGETLNAPGSYPERTWEHPMTSATYAVEATMLNASPHMDVHD